MMLVTIITS